MSSAVISFHIYSVTHYILVYSEMHLVLIHFVALFVLISSFPVDNWRPLCSKEILFDALDEPNLFCALQG